MTFYLFTHRLRPIFGGVPPLKQAFIGFRLTPELREELELIANAESRSVSQICELLLRGGVEAYRKEGPKYLHRLVARKNDS